MSTGIKKGSQRSAQQNLNLIKIVTQKEKNTVLLIKEVLKSRLYSKSSLKKRIKKLKY